MQPSRKRWTAHAMGATQRLSVFFCLFFSFFSWRGEGSHCRRGPAPVTRTRPGQARCSSCRIHGCHMGEDATAVFIVEPGLGLLGTVKLQPLVKPAPRVSSVTLTGGTKKQASQALFRCLLWLATRSPLSAWQVCTLIMRLRSTCTGIDGGGMSMEHHHGLMSSSAHVGSIDLHQAEPL